jgi:uncharacterized membrane protein YvbJ
MFCRNCGGEVANGAVVCLKCGAAVAGSPSQQIAAQVPNHLVGAILVTVFCCQIFGIVSIVYAAQVNSKLRVGDVQGAIASSNRAKLWMWWGFGVGLVVNLPVAIIQFAAAFSDVAGG